ncbi:hypothetical protein BDR22DRAFT_890474 [Usnea florida]
MTTTQPQTYTHPNPLTTLAPHLLHHLPHSLPLLRRIQFHISSPSARTIATFPASSPSSSCSPPPSSFSATWVDRTRAPLTECWMFSTYETLPLSQQQHPHQQQRQEEEQEQAKEAAKSQCLALLADIARSSPPPSPHPRSSVMVIGSLNEELLPIIGGAEAVKRLIPQDVVARDIPIPSTTNEHAESEEEEEEEEGADQSKRKSKNKKKKKKRDIITSISIPYQKYLIAPITLQSSHPSPPLPPTYTLTTIPQTVHALAQQGCLGVLHTSSPPSPPSHASSSPHARNQNQTTLIAWCFLSPDGSLSSLHVEGAHRGRGIAKAVCRGLVRRLRGDERGVGFRAVGEDGDGDRDGGDGGRKVVDAAPRGPYGAGEGWAHSDVAEGNVESAGVARGIGGREGWRVRWVGVDLGAVAAEGGRGFSVE